MLPIDRLQRSNTKENLWIYILSLLRKTTTHPPPEGPRRKSGREAGGSESRKRAPIYAWEIPSLVEKEFNFKPGRITPYRVLYRLEKTGFVKSQMKKRRRVYKITQKGKTELKKAKDFLQKILNEL